MEWRPWYKRGERKRSKHEAALRLSIEAYHGVFLDAVSLAGGPTVCLSVGRQHLPHAGLSCQTLWQAEFFSRCCFVVRGVDLLGRPCIRFWDAHAVFERWLGFVAISGNMHLLLGWRTSVTEVSETHYVCDLLWLPRCLKYLGL